MVVVGGWANPLQTLSQGVNQDVREDPELDNYHSICVGGWRQKSTHCVELGENQGQDLTDEIEFGWKVQ